MVLYHTGDIVLTERELRAPGIDIPVAAISSVVRGRPVGGATRLDLVAAVALFFAFIGILAGFKESEWGSLKWAIPCAVIGVGWFWYARAKFYGPQPFRLLLSVPGTNGYALDFDDERVCVWFAELLAAAMAGRAPSTLPDGAAHLPTHTLRIGRTA